ncbi:MAG: hypothetical protein ACOY81_12285 [Bacillota bacterium]|nr:hypothetical protein [Desulfurispora thermophila]
MSIEEMLKLADRALYQPKAAERNRTTVWQNLHGTQVLFAP